METVDSSTSMNTGKFGKEHLKYGHVSIYNSITTRYSPHVVFTWKIRNYSKRQKNKIHWKSIKTYDFTWTFQFIKAKETLFLNFSTDIANKFVFFSLVSHNKNLQSRTRKCLEISVGYYTTDFSSHVIFNPVNEYLKDDVLIIECRYNVHPVEKKEQTVPYGQFSSPSYTHELCENFKTLHVQKLCPDLTIVVQGKNFPVHKLILRARSKYFDEIFEMDEDEDNITIDEMPEIFRNVLHYMYTCELKDMTVPNLIEIFHIAHSMNIPSLKNRCAIVLLQSMTKHNVNDIYEAADRNSVIDLKNEAAKLMARIPGNMLQARISRSILKQVRAR